MARSRGSGRVAQAASVESDAIVGWQRTSSVRTSKPRSARKMRSSSSNAGSKTTAGSASWRGQSSDADEANARPVGQSSLQIAAAEVANWDCAGRRGPGRQRDAAELVQRPLLAPLQRSQPAQTNDADALAQSSRYVRGSTSPRRRSHSSARLASLVRDCLVRRLRERVDWNGASSTPA